jgi:hypothetical protein
MHWNTIMAALRNDSGNTITIRVDGRSGQISLNIDYNISDLEPLNCAMTIAEQM